MHGSRQVGSGLKGSSRLGGRTSPLSGWRGEVLAALQSGGILIAEGNVAIDREAMERAGPPDESASAAAAEAAAAAERDSDWVEAAVQHAQAILLAPTSAVRYEELGAMLESVALVEPAAAAYRRAVSLDPALRRCRYRLGICCQQTGRLAEAREHWAELVRRYPDDGKGHARLAVVCYYLEDDAAAWRHVHAAEGLNAPMPAHFRVNLAERTPEPPR